MSLDAQKVMELKGFVGLMKQNPQLLHEPSLSFFKDFIESMGGKIPAKAAAAAGGSSGGEASPKAASPKASKKPEPKIVEVESEEDEDPAEIEEYVDTEEDPKKLEEESDEPPAMGPEGEFIICGLSGVPSCKYIAYRVLISLETRHLCTEGLPADTKKNFLVLHLLVY